MLTETRQKKYVKLLLNYLKNLNVFESEIDDAESIYRQKLSTRIYLCMMILSMTCLVTFAFLLPRTINVTVSQPSEHRFIQLNTEYSDTLKCPCTHITQLFGDIVRIQVSFHEICHSRFISQEYIDVIYAANVSFISPVDIRTTISAFWQLIGSFCNLSQGTFVDAHNTFNREILLTTMAESQVFIETKVQSSLNTAIYSAVNRIKRNRRIVRETILGNGFISGLNTNYYTYLIKTETLGTVVAIEANHFPDGCSCSNINGCIRPTVKYDMNGTLHMTEIPGMMFDCLLLDAALASSLECFYDSQCLFLVQDHIPTETRLDPLRNPSRFLRNTTIKLMLDELLIEEQNITIDYSKYYKQCSPKYCAYSYSHRFDIPYIITIATTAFSGISMILRITIPTLVKVAFIVYASIKRKKSKSNHDDIIAESNGKSYIKEKHIYNSESFNN